MTPPDRPLEETSVAEDRERRRTKRGGEFLAYISRMEHGRLLVDVRDGAPHWWKQCRDRRKEGPE